jgi:hypothetical protein
MDQRAGAKRGTEGESGAGVASGSVYQGCDYGIARTPAFG